MIAGTKREFFRVPNGWLEAVWVMYVAREWAEEPRVVLNMLPPET
jgi:hypothetical protein